MSKHRDASLEAMKEINAEIDSNGIEALGEALLAVVELHGLDRKLILETGSDAWVCTHCYPEWSIPCPTIKTIINVLRGLEKNG